MSAPPLTHHEILALAGPLAARGCHVDLAASDRDARRLVLRPPAADGAGCAADGPTGESLVLECGERGRLRLLRTLEHGGRRAVLRAAGHDAAALLDLLRDVPPSQCFVAHPGAVVVRSYDVGGRGRDGRPLLDLFEGRVHADAGLVLILDVPPVRGVAANLWLEPRAGLRFTLPEDLLAVLGWNWARLVPRPGGWMSKLRMKGPRAHRSAKAEAALDGAASHLAAVLAASPSAFHDRHRPARWGVFVRRGIPTLTALSLVGSVALFAHFVKQAPTGLWVTLYHAPTLLLALGFMAQELPRFEIPPWPRPLRAPGWAAPSAH